MFGTSGGNIPPAVALTAPSAGATFVLGDPITITADASDTDGSVVKVEFFRGTTKLGEATAAPYSYTWTNAPLGGQGLTAVATDDAGDSTTSAAVGITVLNANDPPAVALTAPSAGAAFVPGDPIAITADASDIDGSVVKVEFFQGTTKLGEATAAPYSYTWANAPLGGHGLTAVATDDAGDSTTSAAVVVSVIGGGGEETIVLGTHPPSDTAVVTLGFDVEFGGVAHSAQLDLLLEPKLLPADWAGPQDA